MVYIINFKEGKKDFLLRPY